MTSEHPSRSQWALHWALDPDVVFLNHGSFGACPVPVLEYQSRLQRQMEAEPVRFFMIEGMKLLEDLRSEVATFLGTRPSGIAFVANATVGVNTALRALDLRPGDEILVTDQEYPASRNALDHIVGTAGGRTVVASIPFPLSSEDEVLEAILGAVTKKTRFALVDHITSQTGMILPIGRIVSALQDRGIETIVDGAHGPGMLPLELDELGAAFYTGNFHKWGCSPKTGAVFHVREDWLKRARPLVISHGATLEWPGRSKFHLEFDWMGTSDPTAVLSIGESLRFMASLVPGGWPEVRRRNRELALYGRDAVCRSLGISAPAPDGMIGSMAGMPLPDDRGATRSHPFDRVQEALYSGHRIQVPVSEWPRWPRRVLRISAQLYNSMEEYDFLASALPSVLAAQP